MGTRELAIQFSDGSRRRIRLEGQSLSLGRSSDNDLAYPDDPVLSRRHLTFDFDGQEWWVTDLNTTNGTTVDGQRVSSRRQLVPGNQIAAGRLKITLEMAGEAEFGVTFVNEAAAEETDLRPSTSPGAFHSVVGTPPITGSSRVQALLDAGREISSDRPIEELFQVILDLVVASVGGSRGVIMIIDELGQLVPKAMRGSGFRISNAVKDRVLGDKESILILDASRHEVFSSSTTIQRQRVKSLMAAPLQTNDRVLGLVYVDSQDEMRFFLHEDLTLLTLMANMAAMRIDQVHNDYRLQK